jgi:hypothetical protein
VLATLLAFVATGALAAPTLVEAGSEPRSALRITPSAGASQTVRLEFRTDMTMKVPGMPAPQVDMPSFVLRIGSTVNKVGTETTEAQFKVVDFALGQGGELKGLDRDKLTAQLEANFVGTTGRMVTDHRGNLLESDVVPIPGADPNVKEQLSQNLGLGGMELPVEPVGPGASWTTTTEVSFEGMALQQTTVYRLLAVRDREVDLAIETVQVGKPGPVDMDNLPPGAVASMKRFEGGGMGSTTLSLDRVFPVVAENHQFMSMEMGIDFGPSAPPGAPNSMGFEAKVDLELKDCERTGACAP